MGNSTINEGWWLVTFASFIVVFLLFLNHSPASNNISVLQNLTMPINTASNGFPMPNMQSSTPPIVLENDRIRPCIPLTETPSSSQVLLSGLQDAKPETGSSQTPAESSWQNSNSSDATQRTEPALPDLSDSVKQGTILNDKVEATRTVSSSPESSDVTQRTELALPDLSDISVKQGTILNDKVEATRKVSSSPDSSDVTQRTEPALPDLTDISVKQGTILNDKVEATRTVSSSPVPVSEGQNQEQSKVNDEKEEPVTVEEVKKCDIFEGKWVYDPINSPLYDSAMCPFFSETVSCHRNGRPDKEYEKWRWEAKDCKIPRFNAKDMLERLRGKRVVLVGDSINHSQFESLACLLYSAIPDQCYVDAQRRVFRSESYDLIIEFHWAQFLVDLLVNKTDGIKTLKLDSVVPDSTKWKGADIMLFNTGHWWSSRTRWDFYKYKRNVFADMKIETAFKVAMKTWARWVDRNVDTNKTTVFFRGYSAAHFGNNWCYKTTRPYTKEPHDSTIGMALKEIVEKTLQRMRTPVTYLNITKQTEYRVDAHSSIYAKKDGRFLVVSKRKKPEMVADCSHWCLPGVPDTWNHLFYASMVLDRSKGRSTS